MIELIPIYAVAYLIVEFLLRSIGMKPLFEELELTTKFDVLETVIIIVLLPAFAIAMVIMALIVWLRGT